MSREIKNLQDLLSPVLDKFEFVSASQSRLTAPGDNYVGTLLAVDITVKDDEKQKVIRAVAKMVPQNQLIQKIFYTQRTFPNEVGYYEVIAPCLRQFQKEQGFEILFNSFPEFFAARISLNPESGKVDQDAVLFIKNIKDEGFTIMDRKIGFDLEQSKLILDKMAEFHATAMALRALKPEVFDSKLGPFFEPFQMFTADGDGPSPDALKFLESIVDLVKEDEFCSKNIDKIKETFMKTIANGKVMNDNTFHDSHFLSIVHGDMWTNNIMVKIENGRTTDVKFVDYQLYEWNSLVKDVVFFLFTSVEMPVIQQHCDNLFVWYYDKLIKYLKELKYDVSEFEFGDFMDEVKTWVKRFEFFHILMMMRTLYALSEGIKEVEDLNNEDFTSNKIKLAEGCKPKAYFIVQEFFRRGWV